MMWSDYYESSFGVASETHEVITNGLKVECLTLGCNYEEYLPTWDDTAVAKEIHERCLRSNLQYS